MTLWNDGLFVRLYERALADRLAIACGNKLGPLHAALPAVAARLGKDLQISVEAESPYEGWNTLVDAAEQKISREELCGRIVAQIAEVGDAPRLVGAARILVSNIIDTTLHRGLSGALIDAGRIPIQHDWDMQQIGAWRQSDPSRPNVFYMLPNARAPHWSRGVHDETRRSPQNRVQIENIREMLRGRDLLLLGMDFDEAEDLLHLALIGTACDKIVALESHEGDRGLWAERGVYAARLNVDDVIKRLQPAAGGSYSIWDVLVPGQMLIDLGRDKSYDCFISYFSGDAAFVGWLDQSLRLRGIKPWLDRREIDIGDSISARIEEGLKESYSFAIVLNAEALARPMVREELRAAYSLRLGGRFKILPVLKQDCEIPPFLADYRYADFRDPQRYDEQVGLLAQAIENAVKVARQK